MRGLVTATRFGGSLTAAPGTGPAAVPVGGSPFGLPPRAVDQPVLEVAGQAPADREQHGAGAGTDPDGVPATGLHPQLGDRADGDQVRPVHAHEAPCGPALLERSEGHPDEVAAAAGVQARIETQDLLGSLGVELLAVYVQSAKPTPEVGKALEASYRETLLRNADEAIYARRGAAVAEERKIKESELATDIALEEQRQQFIGLQGANAEQEADFRGRALEREAGYRARAQTLELSAYQTLDPKAVLALGLRELGQNANKIGNLTITSEILAALFNGPASAATPLAARKQ